MNAPNDRRGEHGGVLGTLLHVVLLLLVLGQLVYLASRNRARFDLTSDRLWSSTESTRTLLHKLDKRLVIEAYFSPKEKLPVQVREMRAWADSFLDELVQLGKGNVVVQRYDPNSDKSIEDKAKRVGVKPIDLSNRSATSLSYDRHWQGLRFVYGGGKQKVLEAFAPKSSFEAEAIVVPAIKEVATESKRKIGYMEWPATSAGGPQQGGVGWNMLRTHDSIAKRYEFQNLKDEDGALLPADLETLFLYRPKDLTDRQKYVLDQFVVKGGTLVAFCDACEYMLGPQRVCNRLPFALDAAGSKTKLTDQLASYGLDWKPKLVADMTPDAFLPRDPIQVRFEYFAVSQQGPLGPMVTPLEYPYFFHPVAVEWSQFADLFAKGKDGQVDKALAEQYRKTFVPGMPSDEFVFAAWKKTKRGPGFYWPTWVGLRQKAGGGDDLPPDVQGRVLLWSSPQTLVEDPPQMLNPLGYGNDAQQRQAKYLEFRTKNAERLASEPRQQAPLMTEVKGRFTSFFAGQERPKRASEIKEEEAKKAEAAAKDKEGDAAPGDKKDEVTAVTPKPDGPQAPDKTKPDAAPAPVVAEVAMVERGEKPGRILLIGDSDFIRDDLINGSHAQAGGPYSGKTGYPFFVGLLDWLAEDKDLVALQSKIAEDRSLKFVETVATAGADPRAQEQELRSKLTWLRSVNVVLPGILLLAVGVLVWIVRRGQKRTFLATHN